MDGGQVMSRFALALIKPSALGDIVHALPVLSALRCLYPHARISWVVNRSYADLLSGHPHLDEIIPFDRGASRLGVWPLSRAIYQFSSQLRARRFDLVLDLQGLLRSGLMTWATRAPWRMGFAQAREGARWFYTQLIDTPNPQEHAVDRYWRFVTALGGGQLAKRFILPWNESAQAWAARRLADWPRPWVAFHLGTRWETKQWPVCHFAELARLVIGPHAGTAVLIGGTEDRSLAREFLNLLPSGVLNLVGQTSLTQLVALLRHVDAVISNDSGPLHLADALGRPVLAPFTCSDPRRTGPYHQLQNAVATQVWCAASLLKKCNRLDCMRELTPQRLAPRLEALLAGLPAVASARSA